jgi:hypothetical protein
LQEVNYVLNIEPENEIALEILTEIGKEEETVIEYQADTIKP